MGYATQIEIILIAKENKASILWHKTINGLANKLCQCIQTHLSCIYIGKVLAR